jgi:hypothetical protein
MLPNLELASNQPDTTDNAILYDEDDGGAGKDVSAKSRSDSRGLTATRLTGVHCQTLLQQQ